MYLQLEQALCTHSTYELLVNKGQPQRTAGSANYNMVVWEYLTPRDYKECYVMQNILFLVF